MTNTSAVFWLHDCRKVVFSCFFFNFLGSNLKCDIYFKWNVKFSVFLTKWKVYHYGGAVLIGVRGSSESLDQIREERRLWHKRLRTRLFARDKTILVTYLLVGLVGSH